jgi:hypothetical protein
MSEPNTVKKTLTTGVIDAPFFMPSLEGKTTEDDVDYGVLKGTLLEGTIVEGLYRGVKSKENGFSFEVNKAPFTFLSSDEIVKRNVFGGKMCDIFITYAGMGWVYVFYYIPKTGMFAQRMDGGSNGYDRQDNYNRFKSDEFDPTSFPKFDGDLKTSKVEENVQYTLEQLLTLLKN